MTNFTWKKWFAYTATFFIILLLVSVIWNFFDDEDSVTNVFTFRELVKGLIVSVLAGFLFAAWSVHKKEE